MVTREAQVEGELYRFAMNVLEKKFYIIEGLKFGKIERQFPIDSGIADIMVPLSSSKPLVIIECKKHADTTRGRAILRNFDPMSSRVINQALLYAVKSGSPLFATTNGRVFALFTTPRRGEPFRIDKHRLFVKEIKINEEILEEILTLIARWKVGIQIQKTPVDWAFIIRLRSFVDYLSQQFIPFVKKELKVNKILKSKLESFFKDIGKTKIEHYTREATYILMNKIIFYKILERYYGKLSKMYPIKILVGRKYRLKLDEYFKEAIVVTKDFEPIFSTGVYDDMPFPDEEIMLDEIDSFIEDMDTYKLEEIGSDLVGFIYERLLPAEEKHNLGQFYTPPQIAELITKWCIRSDQDKIFDPASGSGTFLVKTYNVLNSLKPLKTTKTHREILNQIFSVDINPFPAHLTAVNLSMRDVRNPTNEMNVIVDDFFNISPNQYIFAPFSIKTAEGEKKRRFLIPYVDALIGNPPYTTWKEIPKKTQGRILHKLHDKIKKYNLRARLRAGIHPGIHMYFLMYGLAFVKEAGRIGVIISNTWLQSDIGISFGKFLLNNFKIKAVIDFSSRIFEIPLIATCVLLLEKCSDEESRRNNKTVFMYIDKPLSVEKIIARVSDPLPQKVRSLIQVDQEKIPVDKKWIGVLIGSNDLEEKLQNNKFFVKANELFDTFRGTINFVSKTSGGVGADNFFYMNKETVNQWGVQQYTSKLVTSPRYCKLFSFNNTDWMNIKNKGAKCYLFNCSVPRNKLSKSALNYIKWGETKCTNKLGAICSKAKACQSRQGKNPYKGWYDLGGIRKCVFFTARYSQYLRRFMMMNTPLALDDGFIAFQPKTKVKLDENQIKAILAYLNSSFGQFFVELYGQTTGGGMVSLDKLHSGDFLIPDVRKIDKAKISKLASLFDELDNFARSLSRADRFEDIERLNPIIEKIDVEISNLSKISAGEMKEIIEIATFLMKRRLSRTGRAKPEKVVGEQHPRITIPKKVKTSNNNIKLDEWFR